MNPGTDDPKDLGSKKMGNQQKQSSLNEGFSGENLPKNYNPSEKLKTELEKRADGKEVTQQRARDTDEKKAPPVDSNQAATTREDGATVSKSRGTQNEAEDIKTAENRDFNSDTEEDRYPANHPENKKVRGNTHFGE